MPHLTVIALHLQLNHNVKNVVLGPMRTSHSRLVITLKDSKDVVTFDKIPTVVAKKMKEYLDSLKQGKQTGRFPLDVFSVTSHFLNSFFKNVKRPTIYSNVHIFFSLVLKTNQGSASFGVVLGNRSVKNDTTLSTPERQVRCL